MHKPCCFGTKQFGSFMVDLLIKKACVYFVSSFSSPTPYGNPELFTSDVLLFNA